MKILFIVLCVCVFGINGQKKGQPCDFYGMPGVCISIYQCPVVQRMVQNDEVEIKICHREGRVRIVCCPTDNKGGHVTGVFRGIFRETNDGIRRSRNMTCRSNGDQPIICCGNMLDIPPPDERGRKKTCDDLPIPTLAAKHNEAAAYAWQQCLNSQQYVLKCVAKEDNPQEYTRQSTCGVDGFRIAIGEEADPREFPHMASLGCQNRDKSSNADVVWIGGGSLISDRFILTAGHVLFAPVHGRIVYALLGSVNKTDIKSGSLYNIINWIPYPSYTMSNKRDDLALVELDRRVKFTEFIRPACLPVPGLEYQNIYTVAGWGATDAAESKTAMLLKADVVVAEGSTCNNTLASDSFSWNGDRMDCMVGKPKNGGFTDSCRGDSGGPLMSLVDSKILHCMYVVRGVVSFGPECGKGNPAVYTKVSYPHYMNWIVQNVWPDYKQKTTA